MTRILVADNYDLLVYSLTQYVDEAVPEARGGDESVDGNSSDGSDGVPVYRNDALLTNDVCDADPDGIVASPRPDTPAEVGVSVSVSRDLDYPTFSVYFGYQSLCAAPGSRVDHVPYAVHGRSSLVERDDVGASLGLSDRIEVGHYHSPAVEREDVPPESAVTTYTVAEGSEAENLDGDTGTEGDEPAVVVDVYHREKPHVDVQSHSESILIDSGKDTVRNLVALVAGDGSVAVA